MPKFHNQRMDGQKLDEFDMDVIILVTNEDTYVIFNYVDSVVTTNGLNSYCVTVIKTLRMLICASVTKCIIHKSDVFTYDMRKCVFHNQRMDGRKLMEFGVVVVPLVTHEMLNL